MTVDGIFLRTPTGLALLAETPYDSEAVLQEALTLYPQVLAGPTTSGSESGLLLISREVGITRSDVGGQAFSLDHLFIDAEGVPVLVEVKRSSDTPIRREVVGQMLDYAANARCWPVQRLQQALETRAVKDGTTSEQLLAEFCQGLLPEDFWSKVDENLSVGRIRMLFVADALPESLRRIIEFLNEQMTPAEVLGIEVQQYVGSGHIVFVPRLVGRTVTAVERKTTGGGVPWTRETFLEAAMARSSHAEFELMRQSIEHCEAKGTKLGWGRGVTPGVSGWYSVDGRSMAVWVVNANGEASTSHAYLMFYFSDIAKKGAARRLENVATVLARIPELAPKIQAARESAWNRWPSVYLKDVVSAPEHIANLFAAVDELIANPQD